MFPFDGRPRRYRQVAEYCAHVVALGEPVPSYSQIASALGIYDRGTVRRYVMQAEEAGLLTRTGRTHGGKGNTSRRICLGQPSDMERKTIRRGEPLN